MELSLYATARVADAGTGPSGIMAVGHRCILRVTLTPQLRAANPHRSVLAGARPGLLL